MGVDGSGWNFGHVLKRNDPSFTKVMAGPPIGRVLLTMLQNFRSQQNVPDMCLTWTNAQAEGHAPSLADAPSTMGIPDKIPCPRADGKLPQSGNGDAGCAAP